MPSFQMKNGSQMACGLPVSDGENLNCLLAATSQVQLAWVSIQYLSFSLHKQDSPHPGLVLSWVPSSLQRCPPCPLSPPQPPWKGPRGIPDNTKRTEDPGAEETGSLKLLNTLRVKACVLCLSPLPSTSVLPAGSPQGPAPRDGGNGMAPGTLPG